MGAEVEKKEMRGIETMTVQVPWKAILRFSIPLFIGSLFQQIYSMADAVIVRHRREFILYSGNCWRCFS